jgi:CHAD domain-containing protein
VTELLLPDGMVPEAAKAELFAHLRLRERAVSASELTFYDTFDGLLHAAGRYAVHERAELSVHCSSNEGDVVAAPWATAPRRVLAIELEPGPLRDALVPIVGVRALLARVHVHSAETVLDVLDDHDKTVVRMVLEEPAVVASSARTVPLRPRVRLAGVRGYDKALAHTQRTLERELGFVAARRPLVDEAVRAVGEKPAGVSAKPNVKLASLDRTDAAAVAVLRALYKVIQANVEGTIADIDAEFLHDFRVAVRRSRAVQREMKLAFPPDELARLRTEFRWLQQSTGDARDLDVYVLEFDDMRALVPDAFAADLDPLLGVLRSHRLTARREMVRALRSDRAAVLWRDWERFLDAVVAAPDDDRPAAAIPIGRFASERISKVYRRMVKMGSAIDDRSPPEALHELRKRGKELRYLLELFGAQLYPQEVVKPMVKSLKSFQDVLGRHQDREVQAARLRALREEVSALPGGPAALMAMGLLVERVAEDQRAARDEFGERFAAFASREQRRLVRKTFGGG